MHSSASRLRNYLLRCVWYLKRNQHNTSQWLNQGGGGKTSDQSCFSAWWSYFSSFFLLPFCTFPSAILCLTHCNWGIPHLFTTTTLADTTRTTSLPIPTLCLVGTLPLCVGRHSWLLARGLTPMPVTKSLWIATLGHVVRVHFLTPFEGRPVPWHHLCQWNVKGKNVGWNSESQCLGLPFSPLPWQPAVFQIVKVSQTVSLGP